MSQKKQDLTKVDCDSKITPAPDEALLQQQQQRRSHLSTLQVQPQQQAPSSMKPDEVHAWLDQHPEFVNDYLRKLQAQRRQELMSDQTSSLLANVNVSRPTMASPPLGGPSALSTTALFRDPKLELEKQDNQAISRNRFKQLGLYEKMYTLVKIVYESLDLKVTCKKILKTVSLLLDADRCSLFLVVVDDEEKKKKSLASVVFDKQSSKKTTTTTTGHGLGEHSDEDDERIVIEFGKGIAGHVAATGQPLNIEDAYADSRFNPLIDKQTGYKTRSILCLPILNEHGECIAVAEAINKLSEDDKKSPLSFTTQDEEIFAKFMPFLAIAIRNSHLYGNSRKEAQTNHVLLELASIVYDECSSTVDNLVSRILFNALLLLECERCQVVLLNKDLAAEPLDRRRASVNTLLKRCDRAYELTYDEVNTSKVYAFSHGIQVKPSTTPTFNTTQINILQTVVQSGEILNIKNSRDDSNYSELHNNGITSLLCIPVINNADQVVALITATDKIKSATLNYFSTSDIKVAQAFAIFCGIGIQNMMMYEKVLRANHMQQVALDVLSYHTSPSKTEVENLTEEPIVSPMELGLQSFDFDENTLDDTGTLKACISMFADLDFIEKFRIPHSVMCSFFLTVKKSYRPVAYHNWRHGFNVMSSMYAMLKLAKYNQVFSDLEAFSLLIACVCHDLDHRGTSNKFQIKIQSPLAKLYTTSTMEHHHFNQCIMILHNNSNNILTNLSSEQHAKSIQVIEKAILATDLALHFQHFDKFVAKSKSPDCNKIETKQDKELILNILMTACDLSGCAKPWPVAQRLSNLVTKEFFYEGDLEREKLKNEPIDMMNRNKSYMIPQMQIQFIQSICMPLYHSLALCNPILKHLFDKCEENIKEWQKLIATFEMFLKNEK